MKTQISAVSFGPATGKFYFMAICLLAGYFCQAQATTTVFYINVPQHYDNCDAGNARLLVEGIDARNSDYSQLYTYHPGRAALIMERTGEFRVTLVGLQCPALEIYEASSDGNATSYELNTHPTARLRCYGGRINVTLK